MFPSLRSCVSLFGAPGSEWNLGVAALRESATIGLLSRRPDSLLTIFDDGWGVRPASITIDGADHHYQLCGVRNSRRIYRPESYAHMRTSARLGLRNAGMQIVNESSAVWDVSGGDSFSDLYGAARFHSVTLPKELALSRGKPLILLPQTYGPFKDSTLQRRATGVLRKTLSAWARDVDSFNSLQELLGADFDVERHRLGVDLAFGLPPAEPHESLRQAVQARLDGADGSPVVGLNVSGLLLKEPDPAGRYNLRVNYQQLLEDLARALLARGVVLVLVPHVRGWGPLEGDEDVTDALAQRLRESYPERVHTVPSELGAGERKWLISKLDWFCGARMHATIAAISSGVPTAAIAYSGKVRGIFASCGQEDQVVDGRVLTTEAALNSLISSYEEREEIRTRLESKLPDVLTQAEVQMDQIVAQSAV
ncbi:polysaccharide pyruvyl transferase WcaK-like protein [Blastococcus colisei]|uniref:Polysaccharide pyruvyl transferase WcaK-like protein n=1 Tax=Blastococcus colisei TaxID=1564162 RepID=A0A543P1Q5_9ACTN|nr:polysaccharide pyruvyl transferase WcaK-like protein [Blastococcus colisei]